MAEFYRKKKKVCQLCAGREVKKARHMALIPYVG